MAQLRSLDDLPRELRFAAGVGVFDGVHVGHCRFVTELGNAARNADAKSVAITFDPHPRAVLADGAPPLLCDLEERVARLERAGLDFVVVQPFDRAFSELSAEVFVDRLADGRDLAALALTRGAALGHGRAGTIEALERLGARRDFRMIPVEPVTVGRQRVSSSRIRRAVAAGHLAEARTLLGRPHAVRGEVIHGDGRGRALGYPTANLAFAAPVALPPNGIYAVRASWGGRVLRPARRAEGVASLGVRPTFGPGDRVLEVFLLDFDELIYGERLRVEFVRRQRGERKFSGIEPLVRQMAIDVERARAILASPRSFAAPESPC